MSKVTIILPIFHNTLWENTLDSFSSESKDDSEIFCVVRNNSDEFSMLLKKHYPTYNLTVISDNDLLNSVIGKTDSPYIYFADPSAVINRQLFDEAAAKAEAADADLVIFGGEESTTKKEERKPVKLTMPAEGKDYMEVDQDSAGSLLFQIAKPVLYNKLIRKELLKDPLFGKNDNPLYVSSLLLLLSGKTILINRQLYTYMQQPSPKDNVFNTGFYEDKLNALEALYDAIGKNGASANIIYSYSNLAISELKQAVFSSDRYDRRLELYRRLDLFLKKTGLYEEPEIKYSDQNAWKNLKGVYHILQAETLVEKKAFFPEGSLIRKASFSENAIPLVSVIIPFYNEQRYLKDCLDSVCRQTLEDIEIICVDDGSTDDSLKIALEAADRDHRISIYKQDNGGLSSARNSGVALAQGKYLYFIDSDDMLEPEALVDLTEKADAEALDVLIFNGKSFCEEDGLDDKMDHYRDYYKRVFPYPDVLSGPEMFLKMKSNDEYRTQVCMQLILRDFYAKEQMQFPNGLLHEDNAFEFRLLISAGRVGVLPNAYYLRRIHAGSIMTSQVSFKNVFGYFYCYLDMKMALAENPELQYQYAFDQEMYYTVDLARKRYRGLSHEERLSYLAFPDEDRRIFEIVVADIEQVRSSEKKLKKDLSDLKKEKSKLKDEQAKLRNELSALRNSRSYRIGRAITWLPRKIRNLFRKK